MATRTKLLRWRNINTDSDFSKYIETVSEPWVIEWLEVSANSVAVWKCWCPCERTNWETIYALVENFSEISIDTSWTWYVIVSIPQNMIDDWSIINEDWTNVASVEVVQSLPSKNYLELAQLSSWSITDKRNMIKKVWELNTAIESLTEIIDDLDERVDELENHWPIERLEEQWFKGEWWWVWTSLFRQKTPTNSNSTMEQCKVWNADSSKEIHIQRIANWTKSNKLKLKVKMVGSPTTSLKVEVRKWTASNSWTEYWWVWNSSQILATWSLSYSNFSTSRAEKEFTLDNEIEVDEWTLLDIVVYQDSSWTKVVNSSNYYILASDSTQWSEWFRFLNVNWNSISRQIYMPFCTSSAFADWIYAKVASTQWVTTSESLSKTSWSSYGSWVTDNIFTATTAGVYRFSCTWTCSSQNASNSSLALLKNSETIKYVTLPYWTSTAFSAEFTLAANDVLKISYWWPSYTTWWFSWATLVRYTNYLSKWVNEHKCYSLENKTIGLKSKVASFWRLPNGNWWEWA